MSEVLKPAIILVNSQLGENIGTVARAMLNFGLTDLRLVNPRQGWDMERAIKASAGADEVIHKAKKFNSTKQALEGLSYIIASTARHRDMVKPVVTLEKAAGIIHQQADLGTKTGILYGSERSGLDNEDISLADIICRVPLNPNFSSLNLAQAVLLLAYRWYEIKDNTLSWREERAATQYAEKQELIGFFEHLEAALDSAGFLSPAEKKPVMMQNLRNLFHRAQLTEQEVRSLRGIINALLRWPRDGRDKVLKKQVLAISKGLSLPVHKSNTVEK